MESRNWRTPLKRVPRYYVRNEVLNMEEDQTHEFKGHRNISVYDIPPWCINVEENIRTRNAISRYWYEEITLFCVLNPFHMVHMVNSTKFLGIHIDSHMNWKNHIEQISHKLSVACFTKRNLTHTLNIDILRMVHFAYFQPVFQYGIILGGNSAHAQQIFKLQKRVIRIMSGTGPRYSCRNLFKKINILPVPSHILSLMLFIIENQQDFFTNTYVHGLDTRHKNHLYLPALSLTCVQKAVLYYGIKIFNKLPSNIQNYKGVRKKFKKELKKYLTVHLFYSITGFL